MCAGATAAAVCAIALAGCGSTSPKAQYVKKLNAMCEDFARREQEIGTPSSPGDLRARGDRIAAAYEQAIVRPIERLSAPPEIAAQAARLREVVQRQLNALRALAEAGKSGDVTRVRQFAALNQQLNGQAAKVAKELKADSCAT
jgi:plasmid stabilization system protein ParE